MSFDLQPNLKGKLIELRPLAPEDWDDLFAVASDPLIWEQHPESDRYKEDVFKVFFREALESGGAFVVIDNKSQRITRSSLLRAWCCWSGQKTFVPKGPRKRLAESEAVWWKRFMETVRLLST
jgi:hypothetical protein